MKKTLIALLSVMVVLAFTASAFALHAVTSGEYTPSLVKAGKSQIELGGQIRIRGNFSTNTDFNDKESDTQQYYDQRVRLSTKANVSDKTMAVVELETGVNRDEDTHPMGTSTYNWGSGMEAKRDALYLRQAYISHQFGTVGGIKAGHMLLALGNRLFFDHSNYGDDALLGWIAVGPGELAFLDIKVDENGSADYKGKVHVADDTDAYVLSLEMPINDIGVSADVTYLRFRDKSDWDKGAYLANLGVRANADLKVVKIKADIEVQSGKAEKATPEALADGFPSKYTFSGYAGMLGVEGIAGPVTIKGGAGYGTGDKWVKSDKIDKKNEGFQTLLTDNQYTTFIYDYSVMGASGGKYQGLNNTMYINVGAAIKPMPDLKVSADVYYLSAAQERALNGARKDAAVECVDTTDTCKKSKKLGYEVDAKIEYQLASNLVYYIEAGYLMAGDAYDRWDSEKGKNVDADDPYRVRHGLILEF